MKKHSCYLSMKYDISCIDPVGDLIESAASDVGLDVTRSDDIEDNGEFLREKIKKDIDCSLIFICEGSLCSWIVAYELSYALEKKPFIILIQHPTPICIPYGNDITQLLPDVIYSKYSLGSKHNRDKIYKEIARQLRVKLKKLHPDIASLKEALQSTDIYKPMHIDTYIPHRLVYKGKEITESDASSLLSREGITPPVVILSPPGGGKSFLLCKLREQVIKSHRLEEEHNRDILVFVNLGSMNARIRNASSRWPWDMLKTQIRNELGSGPLNIELIEGIFKAFQCKGLVRFFLDGLDEYGMKNSADVKNLLAKCRELGSRGIQVYVTSRKWFWDREISEPEGFEKVEILPFSIEQAIHFAQVKKNKQLEDALQTEQRAAKSTSLLRTEGNPLLLSYLADSYHDVETKTDIYIVWAEYSAKKDEQLFGIEKDLVIQLFEELAVVLARERTHDAIDKLRNEVIEKTIPAQFHDQLTKDNMLNSAFFMGRESEKVQRFKHFSIHEFFLAKRLSRDFKVIIESDIEKILKGNEQDSAHDSSAPALSDIFGNEFSLHTVPLDYMGAIIYGFLSDLLRQKDNPFAVQDHMLRFLSDISRSARERKSKKLSIFRNPYFWELMRNCVEYIGFTFYSTSESHKAKEKQRVVDVMLNLITNTSFDTVVTYNAARVLERLHATSPQPYYDFMSDWGAVDWTKRSFDMKTYSYAVRRLTKREARSIKSSPAMAIDFTKEEEPKLEKKVSNQLLKVSSNVQTVQEVRVNCTHALVRWCYRGKDAVNRLEEVLNAARKNQDKFSEINVTKWIRRSWKKMGVDVPKLD